MQELAVTDLSGFCAGAGSPTLLDVREDWEVALGAIRIDGARHLHIPMRQVPARLSEIDAAQPVVCICHHGVRSAQVVAFLQHAGFPSVYNLGGGTDAWSCHVDPALPRY